LWLIGQGDMFLPVRAKSYVACSIKMGIRLELLHFPEKRSTHSVGQVALNHQTMIKDFFSVMLNTIFVTDRRELLDCFLLEYLIMSWTIRGLDSLLQCCGSLASPGVKVRPAQHGCC